MAKKWIDPLDRLLEADQKSQLPANSSSKYVKNDKEVENSISEIDVTKIVRWKYKDRPENELGNIKELSETFKTIGQQQPCILRPSPEDCEKYELIVGERRWKAAEIAGLKLKALIKNLDDKTATLIQAVENEKREDISEFAKGMSYADKIEKGLITQKDLIDVLGISKQQVSRLLSYKKIPDALFEAIGDFRKVSARTAYELSRIASKSESHLKILVNIADKIRDGKYGQKRIEKEIYDALSVKQNILKTNKKILGNDGRHLFTWRRDNNLIPSIHFPKDIINVIQNNINQFDNLTEEIKKCIINKLNLIGKSPRGDS